MGTFFRKKTPEEIAQQEKLDKEKPKSNAEIKAERLKELDKEWADAHQIDGEINMEDTLSITATHKSAVSIDPYFTKWSINSAPIAKKIHIKILDPYNFHVTDVGTTNENFEASVKTIKAGSEYEVTISPNETTLKSSATIRFYTDSKDIPVVYARALVQ
jgi:hypothetical protein